MKKNTLLIRIIISSILFVLQIGYAGACAIEKWPSPLLVQYQKDLDTKLAKIKAFAASKNLCNGAQGTFSNERRFTEFFQSIGSRKVYSANLLVDFQYTIMVTSEGNSRWPVVNQGKILEDLEAWRIIPAVKSVAGYCALDEIDPSTGISSKEALSDIIESHRELLGYYKSVATGNKVVSDAGPMKALFDEILANYNPEITAKCKPDAWVSSIQDVMKKIQERLQASAAKTNNKQDDWKEAIALFSGEGAKTQKYADLQKRLLSAELARQWVTQKARDAMLKKLSCVQTRTTPSSNPEELGKANYECSQVSNTIAENVTSFMQWLIYKSKTSEQFVDRRISYATAKQRLGPDMWAFWLEIQKAKSNDENLNEKMITDLVNIHAQITITNDLLKKKIPEMYANCMKAQPDIKCPQP
jgi:hypothetical protein